MIFIGVDPGKSGGLAVIDAGRPGAYTLVKPLGGMTDRDIWQWFDQFNGAVYFAVIEKVGGFVQGNPVPGSAMFNFGRGYGLLIGCLTAADIPFEEVPPQKWQRGLGVPPRKKSETKTAWKNRLRGFAQKLYPSLQLTLATADALLIATYCQRARRVTT